VEASAPIAERPQTIRIENGERATPFFSDAEMDRRLAGLRAANIFLHNSLGFGLLASGYFTGQFFGFAYSLVESSLHLSFVHDRSSKELRPSLAHCVDDSMDEQVQGISAVR